MQHCIGLGQVEARAPRLEADEEQRHRLVPEAQYGVLAGLGGAATIQIAVIPFFLFNARTQQAQQIDELAEHQHSMTVADRLVQQGHRLVQLAAGLGPFGHHQLGGAAEPTQPGQAAQHVHQGAAIGTLHLLHHLAPGCLIQLALLGGETDVMNDLCLVRQLGQHLLLETTQDEGADHSPQQRHVLGILHRLAEAALELAQAAEQTRVDKGKQAPQLPKVVLNGGAGEGKAKIPFELKQQLGTLGAGILDLLRLVQHHARPAAGLERLRQAAEHAVVEQDHLAGPGIADHPFPLGWVVEHHHLEFGGETRYLFLPVGDH